MLLLHNLPHQIIVYIIYDVVSDILKITCFIVPKVKNL